MLGCTPVEWLIINNALRNFMEDQNAHPRDKLITEQMIVRDMPSVAQEARIGYCKDRKHFEYDSMANIDGIPLIVAHEICNKWGDGCKSSEDGYCFLFEDRNTSGEENE